MMKIVLLILFFIVPMSVIAQEVDSKIDQSKESEYVDCTALTKEIEEDLLRPASCWRDDECKTISWGCPWQFSPCHFSPYSTSEEERNKNLSEKITQFSEVCINSDEKLAAKCEKFYQQVEKNECKVRLELICLNGICSTPIDVILQGFGRDGADIYGSREVIGGD